MEAPLRSPVLAHEMRPPTPPSAGVGGPSQRPALLAHFVWAFVGVGLMLGAWSLATPLGAAPDEPEHTAQAAAIVRGQIDEPDHPFPGGVTAFVRIPCWVDNPWLHYTCAHHAATGLAPTQYSNAPPLYYIVVGVPSLLLSGTVGLYIMRTTGDALNAGLIALGIYLLLRYFPRRTSLIGVLLALSPMVLFMMAVLNSSGFEIAAGFATWCGGLCMVTHSGSACSGDLDGSRRSLPHIEPTDESPRRRCHCGRLCRFRRLAGTASAIEPQPASIVDSSRRRNDRGRGLFGYWRNASAARHSDHNIRPVFCPTWRRRFGLQGDTWNRALAILDCSTFPCRPGSPWCGSPVCQC